MPIFRRGTPSVPPSPGSLAAGGEGGAGPRHAGVSAGPAATIVAPGTRIKGEVTGSTEVQVLGEVEGRIEVDAPVLVGAGGTVIGPVRGRLVQVAGQVTGNVAGTERVEVGAAGCVEGDIVAPRVVIAEGAFFTGKIEMQSDKNRESRRSAKAGADNSKTAASPPAGNAGGARTGSD